MLMLGLYCNNSGGGLLKRDDWDCGDILDPTTLNVAKGDEVIFFKGEDWGGANLGGVTSVRRGHWVTSQMTLIGTREPLI